MRIKIKADAGVIYYRECYRHASPQCGMLHRPEFVKMLEQVQGAWLTVETKHLFKDQFNTAPVEGVSESGLRIMENCVEEVEDDERIGKVRCNYCGHRQEGRTNDVCNHCITTGYMEDICPVRRKKKHRNRGYDHLGKVTPIETD